jgi:hypothetical protein
MTNAKTFNLNNSYKDVIFLKDDILLLPGEIKNSVEKSAGFFMHGFNFFNSFKNLNHNNLTR